MDLLLFFFMSTITKKISEQLLLGHSNEGGLIESSLFLLNFDRLNPGGLETISSPSNLKIKAKTFRITKLTCPHIAIDT